MKKSFFYAILFPAWFAQCESSCQPADSTAPPARSLFPALTWVAYSPTNFNPLTGVQPSMESVRLDLETLRKAGFSGLVTYGSDGILGQKLPELAQQAGFKGLIMGIWNIHSELELTNARAAASGSPIVLGFCMGNEGLGSRYDFDELTKSIADLKALTGKPVATTEQIEDYDTDPALLELGDWVFPNVHPYWHNVHHADSAAVWTQAHFAKLRQRTQKTILFKEVGFPTSDGTGTSTMSETLQDEYYIRLVALGVPFVWFEAFDQTWKQHEPVEPFWGVFTAGRVPKASARRLIKEAGSH